MASSRRRPAIERFDTAVTRWTGPKPAASSGEGPGLRQMRQTGPNTEVHDMTISRFLIPLAALALTAGQGFAQTATQPATPAKPTAPVTAPAAPAAQPAKPAVPTAAQPAQTQKININTATAAELDTLKGIGEARSKKIIEERGKAKFKDFADLVKRGTLPSNVEAEIKDKITF
jgi:competence protein ComEA